MDRSLVASMDIDAFNMHLVPIDTIGVEQLHALSVAVGWPHRAEDWRFLREVGHGVAALDEIGRLLASAMWFPHGETFATVGMVITSPRLQALGAGQWLMQRILADCGQRAIRLNATRPARRLYLSLDFRRDRTVYQCQGEVRRPAAVPSPAADACLRALDVADLGALGGLDAMAFGADRIPLLKRLLGQSDTVGLVRNGQVEAFAFRRRFGRGEVLGPVVAASDEDAIAVVAPLIADRSGRFLRLDTHLGSGAFASFLAECGLTIYDTVWTMSSGAGFVDSTRASTSQPVTYALASQALG